MKIAFLGKGGSGKSTLAAATVRHLHRSGWRVLAIDADHNMDLAYTLGAKPPLPYLGTDPLRIKRYCGVGADVSYRDTREHARGTHISFSINPKDSYTAAVTVDIDMSLSLMVAGPHTDTVRSGDACSHSLAAPLKVYLPLLSLKSREAVVIDERAGTDPVATGILENIDCAFIVVEPTERSVRVAQQIANELAIAGIRHAFIANKMTPDAPHVSTLPASPLIQIDFSPDDPPPECLEAVVTFASRE